jgi:Spy/CpxP family protein refolding chaperone
MFNRNPEGLAMKRILIASLALLACSAAFAQPATRHAHHHHHSGKHHKGHHAHAQTHARNTTDSIADRAEPLDTADFKP